MLRLALMLSLIFAATLARAERRVALVIGNGAYVNTPALANPRNDATAIAATLREIGFDVTEAFDQTGQEMRVTLGGFAESALGADVALVFYAGHGIEMAGQNYLIPVDAQMRSEATAKFEAVSLTDVMATVQSAGRLGIIMLDACRDNPFAATMARSNGTRSVSRGLAPISVEGENGLIVSFAATEGTTADDGHGEHSPYTTALLEVMREPGLEIGRVFRKVRSKVRQSTGGRQVPVERMQLPDEAIYLVPPGAAPAAQPAVQPSVTPGGPDPMTVYLDAVQSNDPAKLGDFVARYPDHPNAATARALMQALQDTAYWRQVRAQDTVSAYNLYLIAFPKGQHVAEANSRLAALQTPKAEAAPLPERTATTVRPSFDCAKASTTVEKAICGNADLARQDRDLLDAFNGAGFLSSLKRTSQRNWLKIRDEICKGWGITVEDCIREVTADRIEGLRRGTFVIGVAPSFNCAHASSVVEKRICGNDALARQDHVLRYVYDWAKAQGRVTDVDQVAWVRIRDARCGKDDWPDMCVAQITQARLERLLRN